MQENGIRTLTKNFRYQIKLKDMKLSEDFSYNLQNANLNIEVINEKQLLIYGSFQLWIAPNKHSENDCKVLTIPFEEKVALHHLNITNISTFDVTVNLLHTSCSLSNLNWPVKIIPFFYNTQKLIFTGQFFCQFFDRGYNPQQALGGHDIIWIASTRWDFIWQRPQQLAQILAENNRVIFFDHSYSVSFEDIQERLENPEAWEKNLRQIHTNLWVFSAIHLTPAAAEHLPHGTSWKEFCYETHAAALKFLTSRLHFSNPVIISNMGEAVRYTEQIPKKVLCYDCVDDFSSFTWSDGDTATLESELIQKSDIVFVTAKRLYEKISQIHPRTFLLPNAVQFSHFAKANQKLQVPDDLQDIQKPIIGFVGAFYEWIDQDLLIYLSLTRPKWNFVMIGPCQADMENKLVNLPNFLFMHTKDYTLLPNYLCQFDVCLIPFKVNSTTESANPIKMWEYMACGKPIVSTPIPEVMAYKDIIYVGKTKPHFLQQIEMALAENDQLKVSKRMAVANNNDWNDRVNTFLEVLADFGKND